LTSNGKFFWFYEHPFSSTSVAPKGSFVNKNHFAHFLALGLGPLAWWVQHKVKRIRRDRQSAYAGFGASDGLSFHSSATWRVIGLGIVLFAILLSLSRGGAVVAAVAIVISIAVSYRAKAIGLRLAAGIGAVTLLVVAGLTVFGFDRVSQRLDDFTAGSFVELDKAGARRTIWETAAKAIPDYAWLGAGAGSFQEVYPMYLPWRQDHHYFTHSENGYLQVALETGLVGLALVLIGIGTCGVWCLTALRKSASKRTMLCVGAVSASLAVSVIHSIIDFVWYVPACMAMVAVLAGCACRLAHLARAGPNTERRSAAVPRIAWLLLAVVVAALGAWMLPGRIGPVVAEPHWQRVERLRQAAREAGRAAAGNQPADLETAEVSTGSAEPMGIETELVAALEHIVRWDPGDAGAHLQLAEAYMQLFDRLQQNAVNRMPLSQVKEAALKSRSAFPTSEAYESWLQRAVGEHCKYLRLAVWHARQGLRLCPLRGEGYLYLAELCFLDGGTSQTKSAYIDQAVAVRPFHGTVLFHAGNEALLAGDFEAWLQYWKRSFNSGRFYQRELMDRLIGRIGPENLDEEIRFFLEVFQPDLDAMRHMYRRYRRFAEPAQLARLRSAYALAAEAEAKTQSGEAAADRWMEALSLYTEPDQSDRRLACARRAMAANPNSFSVRCHLAMALADSGRFAEAEEHLEWCLTQRPDNRVLQRKLREVVRAGMDQGARAVAWYPEEKTVR
jgi:tetratricopeptide (TPR) repeat protein